MKMFSYIYFLHVPELIELLFFPCITFSFISTFFLADLFLTNLFHITNNQIFQIVHNTTIEGYISIKDPFANELLEQLEEGHVYGLFKFNLVKERANFKTVEYTNGLRIQVTSATSITKIKEDDASFPLHYFNFKQLSDIGTLL